MICRPLFRDCMLLAKLMSAIMVEIGWELLHLCRDLLMAILCFLILSEIIFVIKFRNLRLILIILLLNRRKIKSRGLLISCLILKERNLLIISIRNWVLLCGIMWGWLVIKKVFKKLLLRYRILKKIFGQMFMFQVKIMSSTKSLKRLPVLQTLWK